MKIVNTTPENTIENSPENATEISVEASNSLGFEDVTIYHEMADQTSVKMNLLEQIKTQMNQLEEMSARRHFVTKELMNYFSK